MTDGVAVIWDQFGPYHMDRCEALGRRLQGQAPVFGIEIAARSDEYAWQATAGGQAFAKLTLYPSEKVEKISAARRLSGLVRACYRVGAASVLMTHYDRLDTCLLALILRLSGRRPYLMSVSKLDDKPRRAWLELAKALSLLPYCGALVAGSRSASYLRFLGFRRRPVVQGLNTLSIARMVEQGGGALAPDGPAFAARAFVLVGRMVAKKDIGTAIAAYARYRALATEQPRELHICGSGPLESELRRQIADLALEGVRLHGFLQSDGIARTLASGLALVLPSVEEQWGLVVNEALALGLPILATDQVGARDLLVRTAVNGYVFEPGNVEGLARLMLRLAEDEAEWRRLAQGSRALRAHADSERFADGVLALLATERGRHRLRLRAGSATP